MSPQNTETKAGVVPASEQRYIIKIFMPVQPALYFKNTTKAEVIGYVDKSSAADDPKASFPSLEAAESKIRELEKHPNASYLIFSAQPVS